MTSTPTTIIQPRAGSLLQTFQELWEFRELVWVLALRNIKVRYRQAVLGIAWAGIQPFATMIVFTLFFGKLAGLETETGNIPYPIFSFAALVPWFFFSTAMALSANSLVEAQAIITKVFFPRIILLIVPIFSGLIDLMISLGILVGMMLWFGLIPTLSFLAVFPLILFTMITIISFGLWTSALNAHYRDLRYIVPFALQTAMFLSPIVYPTHLIKDQTLKTLYSINPLVGIIEGFRWSILPNTLFPGEPLLIASIIVGVLLIGGFAFFRRMERTFVDVI
jgi:lipopolysaccharide transport system permease protein